MSPKRLRWTGLACLSLSALIVGLGVFAQTVGVALAIVLFHIVIQVPVSAVGGTVGPTTLPIPRILPTALFIASLFAMAALMCFVKSTRSATNGASRER